MLNKIFKNKVSNKYNLDGPALELYLNLLQNYKEALDEVKLQAELIELLKTKNKDLSIKNYNLIKDYNDLVKDLYKK